MFIKYIKKSELGYMESYCPLIAPIKEEWLALSEQEQLDIVKEFHQTIELDLDVQALSVHCSIHVIVENQLAMGVELLPQTLARLIRQGLDRHDAIHAIGAVICEDIFEMVNNEGSVFSPKRYRRKLEKLTAKRWNKGLY
jgi:hypothetical protein